MPGPRCGGEIFQWVFTISEFQRVFLSLQKIFTVMKS